MREILFRGKRTDNGEWVYGDLTHSVYKIGDTCVGKYGCEIGMHQVDPSTVGQYTGLTDKNGKKVYEGDIFKIRFGFAGGREPKYTPADYPKGNVVDIYEWVAFENGNYCLKTKFPASIPSISRFIGGVKERDLEFCLRTTPVVISEKTFGSYSWRYYEILGGVVGNIYDNPELLGEVSDGNPED